MGYSGCRLRSKDLYSGFLQQWREMQFEKLASATMASHQYLISRHLQAPLPSQSLQLRLRHRHRLCPDRSPLQPLVSRRNSLVLPAQQWVLVSVVLPTDPRAVLVPSQRFSLSHDTMIQGRVIHLFAFCHSSIHHDLIANE